MENESHILKKMTLGTNLDNLYVLCSNVESCLLSTSTNPVENRVIYTAISALSADIGKIDSALEKILGE